MIPSIIFPQNLYFCFVTQTKNLLQLIKHTVTATDPAAEVILFGSYARGDYNDDSDIDLVVLLNQDHISYADETRISFPLYKLEINSGIAINPIVYSKDFWTTKHKVTPFYEHVNREGVVL